MLTKKQEQELLLEVMTYDGRIPLLLCPSCMGGRTKEKTFSITVADGIVLYNCFRASCPTYGSIPYNGCMPASEYKKPKHEKFTYPTVALSEADYAEFEIRYEVGRGILDNCGVRYCPDRGSLVFPALDFNGYQIGIMERWYAWKNKPREGHGKAFYWKETDHPKLHVPPCRNEEGYLGLVVVEDHISAFKSAHLFPSLAALGTSLSADTVAEIRKAGYNRLILALDPGAEQAAIKIRKDYDLYFKSIQILTLDKDPKDTPKEVLYDLLKEKQAVPD